MVFPISHIPLSLLFRAASWVPYYRNLQQEPDTKLIVVSATETRRFITVVFHREEITFPIFRNTWTNAAAETFFAPFPPFYMWRNLFETYYGGFIFSVVCNGRRKEMRSCRNQRTPTFWHFYKARLAICSVTLCYCFILVGNV